MTREEEYKKLHQELWQWLADHPEKFKSEWPRWLRNGGDVDQVINFCFACALYPSDEECRYCPCDWERKDNVCDAPGSPYWDWMYADYDLEKRSEHALRVKNAWK